jgi:hypothetical protein
MRKIGLFTVFAAGVVAGVFLVVSCSDDSPPRADASACDCPEAEAPLAGRIVEVVNTTTLPPANMAPDNGRGGEDAGCPGLNDIALSGGCTADVGQVPDIVVQRSEPGSRSWSCSWKNNTNQPVIARVIVRCLQPKT